VRFENKKIYFEKNALAVYNAGVVVVNPGANPTITSLNATSSLVRFESKNILFYFYIKNAPAFRINEMVSNFSVQFFETKLGTQHPNY
jgi:hypothetical protein